MAYNGIKQCQINHTFSAASLKDWKIF